MSRPSCQPCSSFRHALGILAIGWIALFTGLGSTHLWDRDEPRNAGCAREMLAQGDWVVPVFNSELRTHKPILVYWLMMSAYGLFGVTEFGARFWSAAFGIGTALVTYSIGRRLMDAQVGWWAAVILLTTLMFNVASHAATPDALLIFWSTLSIGVYVWGTHPADDSLSPAVRPSPRWFPRWPVAVAMYACMGVAVLAKGPVGLVLPTAVIGLYLLIMRWPRPNRVVGAARDDWPNRVRRLASLLSPIHFLRTCWLMRPVTALVTVAVVALPWYTLVWLRTDGEWVRGFLLDHNLGRATQSLEGHHGSFLFYPVALLVGFFPWSVFAVPTIWHAARTVTTDRNDKRPGHLLAICWTVVYVCFFTMAATKLPSYITPSYPAVALLVSGCLWAWIRHSTAVPKFWFRAALVSLVLVGLVIIIGVPVAASELLPGEGILGLIGLIPMVTGAIGLYLVYRDLPALQPWTMGAGALLTVLAIFALASGRIDRHQSIESFVSIMRGRSAEPVVGALGVMEPSWVFYTEHSIERFAAPEQTSFPGRDRQTGSDTAGSDTAGRMSAWDFLRRSDNHFLIATRSSLDRMKGLPDGVMELADIEYFLKRDRLVLLARTTPDEEESERVLRQAARAGSGGASRAGARSSRSGADVRR